MKILLVEDDENLGFITSQELKKTGHEVAWAKDGQQGLDLIKEGDKYDICLLDVMLPKMDGFSLAKEIKSFLPEQKLLFLTARSQDHDRIHGLELGADDYISKPFNMRELELRLNIISSRQPLPTSSYQDPISFGKFLFDYESQELKFDSECLRLGSKECELLFLLVSNLGKVVTRDELLMKVWGEVDYFKGRSMDVYLSKIRKILSADTSISIQTVHGKGVKLELN